MATSNPEPTFEDFISGSAMPILMPSIETDDDFVEHRHGIKPTPLLTPPSSASKLKAPHRQLEENQFIERIYIDLTESSPEPSSEPSRPLGEILSPQATNERVVEIRRDIEGKVDTTEYSAGLGGIESPKHTIEEGSALTSTGQGALEFQKDEGTNRQSNPPSPEPPISFYNPLSCQERKRLVVSLATRPAKLTQDLKAWLASTNWLLDPFREDDECWFHPSPPPPRLTKNGLLIARRTISKRFTFTCPSLHAPYQLQTHSLTIPYGIAHHLVYHTLTLQQQDGWINQNWQNSHLCGNWTCLNPKHLIVESQGVNVSRNNYFSHRRGCFHNPACLKDLKVPLGSDGLVVRLEEGGVWLGGAGEGNDWAGMEFGEDGGFVDYGDLEFEGDME